MEDIKINFASKEDIKDIINLSRKNLTFHKSFREDLYDNSNKVLDEYEKFLLSIIDNQYYKIVIAKKKR
jgi:hypothetical protein